MAMGPLAVVLFVGFTIAALVLIFTELTSGGAKLLWLALLVAGIYFAPTGAHALAPIATALLLGGKAQIAKVRGSAV
jgi:hypothetical protein